VLSSAAGHPVDVRPDELALRHLERHAVQRDDAAEAARQAARFEQRHRASLRRLGILGLDEHNAGVIDRTPAIPRQPGHDDEPDAEEAEDDVVRKWDRIRRLRLVLVVGDRRETSDRDQRDDLRPRPRHGRTGCRCEDRRSARHASREGGIGSENLPLRGMVLRKSASARSPVLRTNKIHRTTNDLTRPTNFSRNLAPDFL